MTNPGHSDKLQEKANWERALAKRLKRRWKRYRKALRSCQRGFTKKSIHDSRIEARRMAAQLELLKVFADVKALEQGQCVIKEHLDSFDRLRDAQVQLGILEKECSRVPGARAVGKIIGKREHRCRGRAEKQIRKVETRRLRRLVKLLGERLKSGGCSSETMRVDFRSIIQNVDQAFEQVVRCREKMSSTDLGTIHRTRVAFKKFRYMVESLQPQLLEVTPRRLAVMKDFQGMLGDLQDTNVFLARVRKLVKKGDISLVESSDLRRWLVRRQERQLDRCLRRADLIFGFWPLKIQPAEPNEHVENNLYKPLTNGNKEPRSAHKPRLFARDCHF